MHPILILLVGGACLSGSPNPGPAPSGPDRATARVVPDPVPTSAGDTTFAIPSGSRLVIQSSAGDVDVVGTDGREARILVDGEPRGARVSRSGSVFRVAARGRYGDADLTLWVPSDIEIDIQGSEGDIRVTGLSAGVTVQTVDGDITIDGVGAVAAHTVDGDVRIHAVPGAVAVNVGDGDIHLERVGGPLVIESVDGDIVVLGAEAASASLSTVGGDVWYEGTVARGGTYELATHDGDVTFAIPEGTGARVSVFTWDGTLHPSFPIQLRGSLGSITEFTLGSGGASVRLESFDGDIFLVRPGERTPGPEEE